MTDQKRLSVLIISPDPRTRGGVSEFIKMMVPHLQSTDVTHFAVGSTEGIEPENSLKTVWRLMTAPFRVASLVRHKHFDVVHINPSLEPKPLLRDGMILVALRAIKFRRVFVYFHGWRVTSEACIRAIPPLRWVFTWVLNGTASIMVLAPEFEDALVGMGVRADKIVVTSTMFDGAYLENPLTA
ncbi:MAG: glycosyltransferase [Terriglobales bacterium]|jgi:hypothetical protein